jgi:hypothetical protein
LISQQVLLVVGTADKVVGPAGSKTLAALIPGAWLAQFKGGGHPTSRQLGGKHVRFLDHRGLQITASPGLALDFSSLMAKLKPGRQPWLINILDLSIILFDRVIVAPAGNPNRWQAGRSICGEFSKYSAWFWF